MNHAFRGKIAIIYLMKPSPGFANGIAVKDPRLEEINGRFFVTGIGPETEEDWAAGLRIAIAFDQIEHFIEFATEQEYVERAMLWNIDEKTELPI